MNKLQRLIAFKLDDLNVQAMLFDMDIDIESWSLTPKDNYKEAPWLTRWKGAEHAKDADNRFDYDQE